MESELWKQAYHTQYGTDADQDMIEHTSDVEEWRINWQSGYDAGEDWAKALLNGPAPSDEGSPQPMLAGGAGGSRTFADLEREAPSIRQRYDTWRNEVASRGEDSTDWDRFRSYLTANGSPDPGSRPPDDFVGDEWKSEHPEWVARYSNRAA